MGSPRSIRFDDSVIRRLTSFVERHPGLAASSVAARLVDEGLRMDEHPGVMFREGPMGRRATLVGGPDVWEVVRAVRRVRSAEPALAQADLLDLVEENTGVPERILHIAIEYWAAYPEEVESLVAHSEQVEAERMRSADRSDQLLGG